MPVGPKFEAALRSPEPVVQLRSLAQHLLAEHRDHAAVTIAFEDVRRQLRDSGRDADEDAVMDVLDFLTGWCSPIMKLHQQRIAAVDYWDAFSMALRGAITDPSNVWPTIYKTDGAWTPVIKGACERAGEGLKIPLGPRTNDRRKEYMKIDHALYRIHDEERGKRFCNWDCEVAVEIESNGKGKWAWLEEFTRLSHLNAGLKVLITYLDFASNNVAPCKDALSQVEKLYRARTYKQVEDRWLFIFGQTYKNLSQSANIDFRAFSWAVDNWPGAPQKEKSVDLPKPIELLRKDILPAGGRGKADRQVGVPR